MFSPFVDARGTRGKGREASDSSRSKLHLICSALSVVSRFARREREKLSFSITWFDSWVKNIDASMNSVRNQEVILEDEIRIWNYP